VSRLVQLSVAIATGIARSQSQRRRAMFALTVAALLLLLVGITVLWSVFPDHPLFFAIYWMACAWLAICVMLLAVYDLMMVVRRGRKERESARRELFGNDDR
jgi:uncharacterized membrane protein